MVKILAADPCASMKPNLVKNAVVATVVDTAAAVAEIAMVAVAVAVTIVVAVAAVTGDQTS